MKTITHVQTNADFLNMLGSSFFAGKMKGSMLLLLNAKVIHQMLWIQAGVEVVLLAMPEEYPQLHQGVVCKSYVSQVLRVSTLVDCVLLRALHTISLKIHQKKSTMWDNPVHICPVLGSCCGADRSHNRQRTALWRVKQKQFNLSTEASGCKSASLIHFFFFF